MMTEFSPSHSSVNELRKRVSLERRRMTPVDAAAAAEKIRANFLKHFGSQLSDEPTLAMYRPSEANPENEVDPSPLMKAPELVTAHFAFPRVLDRFHRLMDFTIPIHSRDWSVGVYGLPEPRVDLPEIPSSMVDLFIIPGVVFGESGERIGRGGGFYDRYLSAAPKAIRVAFAYDFQVFPDPIPQEAWDARVDWIVTERRVIQSHARG